MNLNDLDAIKNAKACLEKMYEVLDNLNQGPSHAPPNPYTMNWESIDDKVAFAEAYRHWYDRNQIVLESAAVGHMPVYDALGKPTPEGINTSKLSDLLYLAIAAQKYYATQNGVTIDQRYFRTRGRKGVSVCLAGAARCILEGWTISQIPTSLNKPANTIESAVDGLRRGDVGYAYHHLNSGRAISKSFDRPITDYSESPKKFYQDLTRLAQDLRKEGY